MEVGRRLSEARQRRNLALADIARSTKIPLHFLEAIERDDVDRLPPDFFARAFVRTYATHVGVDPGELLDSVTQPENAQSDSNLQPVPSPVREPISMRPLFLVMPVRGLRPLLHRIRSGWDATGNAAGRSRDSDCDGRSHRPSRKRCSSSRIRRGAPDPVQRRVHRGRNRGWPRDCLAGDAAGRAGRAQSPRRGRVASRRFQLLRTRRHAGRSAEVTAGLESIQSHQHSGHACGRPESVAAPCCRTRAQCRPMRSSRNQIDRHHQPPPPPPPLPRDRADSASLLLATCAASPDLPPPSAPLPPPPPPLNSVNHGVVLALSNGTEI